MNQGKPTKETSLSYKVSILWDAAIREAFRLKFRVPFATTSAFSKFVFLIEILKNEACVKKKN